MVATQRSPDDGLPLQDQTPVPASPILIGEADEPAALIDTRRRAGVEQQHQGKQSEHFGFVGHELREQPTEADRLGAELAANQTIAGARRISLVEDEIDHREDGAKSGRPIGVVGHAVGDSGIADFALRADQPLRHRGLRHQKRASDLGGRQPAKQPERQRDLRRQRQCRMAAGENQAEAIVAEAFFRVHIV